MLKSELKLPFIWYNSLTKQFRFRPQNLYGDYFKLISPPEALLPFQIKMPAGATAIIAWKLVDLNDNDVMDLLPLSLIDMRSNGESQWLIYKGDVLSVTLPPGCYYSRIETNNETIWYSEIFRVTNDLSRYVQLVWWNSCDIDPVIYQTGYVNVVYLDTYSEVVPAELHEEGNENGTGEFIPTLQRLVHKHKIEFFAPDYLLDAMAFMQMHESIGIAEGEDEALIKKVKVEEAPGEYSLGTCKVEFELPGDYVRTTCCNNINLSGGETETCDIEITEISAERDTFGITTVYFTPVLNGEEADRYEWSEPGVDGGAWQNIGTDTSFVHSFPMDTDITVSIRALCIEGTTGEAGSVTIPACVAVSIPADQQLPDAVAGQAYSKTIDLAGALPITLADYTIPSWMNISLSGSTVTLSGTPAASNVLTFQQTAGSINDGIITLGVNFVSSTKPIVGFSVGNSIYSDIADWHEDDPSRAIIINGGVAKRFRFWGEVKVRFDGFGETFSHELINNTSVHFLLTTGTYAQGVVYTLPFDTQSYTVPNIYLAAGAFISPIGMSSEPFANDKTYFASTWYVSDLTGDEAQAVAVSFTVENCGGASATFNDTIDVINP